MIATSVYSRCDHGDCTQQRTITLLAQRSNSNIIDHYHTCASHAAEHIALLLRDGYWGGAYIAVQQVPA